MPKLGADIKQVVLFQFHLEKGTELTKPPERRAREAGGGMAREGGMGQVWVLRAAGDAVEVKN